MVISRVEAIRVTNHDVIRARLQFLLCMASSESGVWAGPQGLIEACLKAQALEGGHGNCGGR
eukprot:6192648-Pleurochrysis_carterae.AAC.2